MECSACLPVGLLISVLFGKKKDRRAEVLDVEALFRIHDLLLMSLTSFHVGIPSLTKSFLKLVCSPTIRWSELDHNYSPFLCD